MRWVTEWIDRASRFSTCQLARGGSLRSRDLQNQPPVQQLGIVADRAIAYPQLFGDLGVLVRLLHALRDNLVAAKETVSRHSQGLTQLTDAMQTLSRPSCPDQAPDQFIIDLELVFKRLNYVEDDLTSSSETIMLHSFKLQNLDLATQMLVEVFAEIVTGGGDRSVGASKLQRLETKACVRAGAERGLAPLPSRELLTSGAPNQPCFPTSMVRV